jgi:hypothetical protein
VDSKDNYNRTPLSLAARSGYEAIVKLLFKTGDADVDSKDDYSETPLSWAASGGHEAVVKLLLETGKANVDSKDYYGRTPLSWAKENWQKLERLQLERLLAGQQDSEDDIELTGYEAVVNLLQSYQRHNIITVTQRSPILPAGQPPSSMNYNIVRNQTRSDSLCTFCGALPLKDLGVCKESRPEFWHRRERNWKTRRLTKVLESSQSCGICKILKEGFDCCLDSYRTIHSFAYYTFLYELREEDGTYQGLRYSHISLEVDLLRSPPDETEMGQDPLQRFCFESCFPVFPWQSGLCPTPVLYAPLCQRRKQFHARSRPSTVDWGLLQSWKDHCDKGHGHSCAHPVTNSCPVPLRLIDVKNRCIVDAKGSERYVALSYVWGGETQKLKITSENLEDYQKAESLRPDQLSSTIRDAITATCNLQESYLWVDCLCILQDSHHDQAIYFPIMSEIYGRAAFTIVCASGSDSNSGLPGVRRSSRSNAPKPIKAGGLSFAASFSEPNSEDPFGIASSAWNGRAWTYQEIFLSKRVFFFTPTLVTWICRKAAWREDKFWEGLNSKGFTRMYKPYRILETSPLPMDSRKFFDLYSEVVDEFTRREMHCQEDGLYAVKGILGEITRLSGTEFNWALPLHLSADYLLWWRTHPKDQTRRTAKHMMKLDGGGTEYCDFPSWSWVGWTGKVHISTDGWVIVELYVLDRRHIPQKIGGSSKTDRETIITHELVSKNVSPRSYGPTILCFWSEVASASVGWSNLRVSGMEHGLGNTGYIFLPDGTDNPFTWLQMPCDAETGKLREEHFILVGEADYTSYTDIVPGDFFFILCVSRNDGLAYRRGLARLKPWIWHKLARTWQPVFLG